MTHTKSLPRWMSRSAVGVLAMTTLVLGWIANAQDTKTPPPAGDHVPSGKAAVGEANFKTHIQPLLKKSCLRCHNADNMESGIRLDQISGKLEDKHLFLLRDILKQVANAKMPPEDELQPSAEQRRVLTEWIRQTLVAASARNQQRNGSVRRLTVSQYRNTLRDLLGLDEDLTEVLPPDAVSKEGFVNNSRTMLLSPLLLEAYLDIAETALNLCIVEESAKPVIQNFRMDLGRSINPKPCPDNLILGANSLLLKNQDVLVTQLQPTKSFEFQPFSMRTKYEFIEGYQGNATVRGWRKYDDIYHSVFACMRGTGGYPRGQAYETVPEGLLLRPSIPSSELFGQSSTYGPKANFKVSLRELPDHGNFKVKVKAARYNDGLLLPKGAQTQASDDVVSVITADLSATAPVDVTIDAEGIYEVGLGFEPNAKPNMLSLDLGERHFSGQLIPLKSPVDKKGAAFVLVRLKPGPLKVTARNNSQLRRIIFSRLHDDSELAKRFKTFEQRTPQLSVFLGLRRDCGSTLARVGEARPVSAGQLNEFVFEGAINNFPSPDVEKDNVNYLAGIREIGVRSDYTDGRDMPRLLIRSIEFEGPYHETWPPVTHRNIFIDSPNRDDPAAYARDVIRTFAARAFRRPISDAEAAAFVAVWQDSFAETRDQRRSIKDALLVVLTSPQFLFLIENSSTPKPEALDAHELASKLSYFLWNSAPDKQLLERAAAGKLHQSLDAEFERMTLDPRFNQFVGEFTSQWLSLDKFDVVEIDSKRYPKLTRDTKTQLRQEPVEFLRHLIKLNLPLSNLIRSDFIVANEVVASYYDLGDRTESGFEFVPIKHGNKNLGGILSQAGILAGLSDGRESNPVKRGAWLARKIIAAPPDDPPPNVPQLMDDGSEKLTLRQRLERHRNQKGCANCHAGIDPWGVPFETFDAGGLFKKNPAVDARSTLPDKTEVADLNELKTYLADDRIDRVAFSFLKHLAGYAVGRSLTYNEVVFLEEQGRQLKAGGYRMQDMIRFVIKSDVFLKK
ncbi:MAG: DUF1592 domain-containing protein [Planctomycetota bacterium]|nr:DUF1592 domain-containing protein [Planctomycetota bacterium]